MVLRVHGMDEAGVRFPVGPLLEKLCSFCYHRFMSPIPLNLKTLAPLFSKKEILTMVFLWIIVILPQVFPSQIGHLFFGDSINCFLIKSKPYSPWVVDCVDIFSGQLDPFASIVMNLPAICVPIFIVICVMVRAAKLNKIKNNS